MCCLMDYDPSSVDDVRETNSWPTLALYQVTWLPNTETETPFKGRVSLIFFILS